MSRYFPLSAALFVLLLSQSAAAQLPALHILTEDDPPLTFSQNGQPAGLVVEVVREIQRRVGSHDPITVMPWARGYLLAQTQANTALFNTNRIAEREHLFKWVGPVTATLGSFFVRRDSKLKLVSLDDARKLDQILVVRDWYLQLTLSAQGFSNLSAIATPNQMVSMLMRGRADVIASEKHHAADTIGAAGVSAGGCAQGLHLHPHLGLYRLFAANFRRGGGGVAAGAGRHEAGWQLRRHLPPLAAWRAIAGGGRRKMKWTAGPPRLLARGKPCIASPFWRIGCLGRCCCRRFSICCPSLPAAC
ncbi:substrate-binding periplasmic protein [Chromobacterium subtsugae]|uniref:substrate-binding periplasmic protein n=1 Tax=Chromobacterium subtsugae TaxID=251747 RepID=UPI0009B98BE0|nr:ABC transporter substrate-binding protein [Chromobacterium subtsugae]